MKEKIILIVGVIAFAIILVLASEVMKNPEINNQNNMNSTGNFNSIEVDNSEQSNIEESKIIYANEKSRTCALKDIIASGRAPRCSPHTDRLVGMRSAFLYLCLGIN